MGIFNWKFGKWENKMYLFCGIALVILSGTLVTYLDYYKKMKEPIYFYFMGQLCGMLAIALMLK